MVWLELLKKVIWQWKENVGYPVDFEPVSTDLTVNVIMTALQIEH